MSRVLSKVAQMVGKVAVQRWWRNIDIWSWIATALIFLGIVAEIVLLFVFPHWETWGELSSLAAANGFIGIGLAIELICIRKSMAEKRQSEERLTDALNRAVSAENSLIELRRPRRSLLTAQNRAKLIPMLQPFAGTEFDVGVSGLDTEIVDCLWDLEEVLQAAGWQQIPWTSPVGAFGFQRNLRPTCGLVSAEKITLEMDPNGRQGLLPAANAIIGALAAIGIEASEHALLTPIANVQAIHLYVGPKL